MNGNLTARSYLLGNRPQGIAALDRTVHSRRSTIIDNRNVCTFRRQKRLRNTYLERGLFRYRLGERLRLDRFLLNWRCQRLTARRDQRRNLGFIRSLDLDIKLIQLFRRMQRRSQLHSKCDS